MFNLLLQRTTQTAAPQTAMLQCLKRQQQKPLLFLPQTQFGLRIRVARQINFEFENERKQHKKDMSARRKEHREEYWRMQTQIENKHFEDFRAERKQKNRQDMDKWRTQICRLSLRTKEKIAFLEEKERKTLETMRHQDIRNMRKNISNKLMLDGLEMEAAKSWPNMTNLSEKIDTDVIVPQSVLNFTEYQNKLQRLAIFAEMGQHKAMQEVLDNQLVLEKKNQLLQPVFRDIKSQIRHMSYTPEYEIMRDYVSKRKQIEQSVKGQTNAEWKAQSFAQLRELYAILLAKREQKIRGSVSLRLKTLQKRLENIFELMSLWNQYIEVIYMPEAEVHMVDQLAGMEGRLDDMSYVERTERDQVSKRIKMLFNPDFTLESAAEKFNAKEAVDEAYETVNEGATTDTTSGLDTEGLLDSRMEDAGSNVAANSDAQKATKVESGIKSSSDSEGEAAADEEPKREVDATAEQTPPSNSNDEAKVLADKAEQLDAATNSTSAATPEDLKQEVTTFAGLEPESTDAPFFADDRTREQTEHAFGFSGSNIEEYSAVLENKLEALESIELQQAKEDERKKQYGAMGGEKTDDGKDDFQRDFIGGDLKAELEDLDSKVGDLQSLNLFGVEMNADSVMEKVESRKKGATKEEINSVLQDLVQMVAEVDPQGTTRDFSKRKSFVYYDPYNPDKSSSFAHLKYEDSAKLRASLIVQNHVESLQEISDQLHGRRASVADRQRFESIQEMLERLSDMKIIDPQVLLRLYNMYRYHVDEELDDSQAQD